MRKASEQTQTLNFLLFYLQIFRHTSTQGLSSLLCTWAPTFLLSSYCPGECSLSSLLRHVSEPTSLQIRVVRLLPTGVRGRTYQFSVVPHPRRRFGTSGFFSSYFNYNSHSSVTSWLTRSNLAGVIQRSAGRSHRFSALFVLFFLLSHLPQRLSL